MEKSHHQLKTNKGFTLIELLVVITLLGIFAVVAYPNVIKWINDREVKAEAMRTAGFINEMRSTVGSGKYGMLQAILQSDVNVYTMSKENFRNIYLHEPEEVFIFGVHSKDIDKCINHPKKTMMSSLSKTLETIFKQRTTKNILFSPGYPSGKDFNNFKERGEYFNLLLKNYISSICQNQ